MTFVTLQYNNVNENTRFNIIDNENLFRAQK